MTTPSPIYRIEEGAPNGTPQLPCWMWKSKPLVGMEPLWLYFTSVKDGPCFVSTLEQLIEAGGYTHWSPDSATPPTSPPERLSLPPGHYPDSLENPCEGATPPERQPDQYSGHEAHARQAAQESDENAAIQSAVRPKRCKHGTLIDHCPDCAPDDFARQPEEGAKHPPLPEDVRWFVEHATLLLQRSRGAKPHEMDAMFQTGYRLYTKYDVENRIAPPPAPPALPTERETETPRTIPWTHEALGAELKKLYPLWEVYTFDEQSRLIQKFIAEHPAPSVDEYISTLRSSLARAQEWSDAKTKFADDLLSEVRELRAYRDRMHWLHSGSEKDAESYEWGVYRVKWDERGQLVDALHTLTDLADLDAAMGASGMPRYYDEVSDLRAALARAEGERDELLRCVAANDKWHLEHRGNPLDQDALQKLLGKIRAEGYKHEDEPPPAGYSYLRFTDLCNELEVALRASLQTATEKLAEAEADKERLDWLEANMGKVVPGSGDAKFWILGMKEFAPNKATNVRAAIDAARTPEATEGKQ